MNSRFKTLRNHVVICGYGNVGRRTAEELTKSDLEIIIIEKNNQEAEEASESGFLVIESDATEGEAPLQQAQIQHAVGLIAALPDDASNVYVCMVGRGLNKNLRIIY